jgi:hypothetical protein
MALCVEAENPKMTANLDNSEDIRDTASKLIADFNYLSNYLKRFLSGRVR